MCSIVDNFKPFESHVAFAVVCSLEAIEWKPFHWSEEEVNAALADENSRMATSPVRQRRRPRSPGPISPNTERMFFSLSAEDPDGVAEPEALNDSPQTKKLKRWYQCEIFCVPMKKMSQRCQRAQFLHGREWTVPHQVRLLVQLLLRPNGPTSGAHALFVPEPCIHVVHQRVPTLVSIESGATTSTSSPMASACAGTQVLVSVLLRICRRWFAPSEHPFWKIFPFNFVKVRYVCSGTHVLPCFEKKALFDLERAG